MDDTNKKIDDILEIVTFIKDTAVGKEEFNELQADVSGLKSDVNFLKADVAKIQSQLVTKEYLNQKMDEQRTEIIRVVQGEDSKLKTVVHKLADKQIFTPADVHDITLMAPFAGQTIV